MNEIFLIRIRKLNDLFRTTFSPKMGEVFMTSAIQELEDDEQTAVMRRVTNATSFDERDHSRGFFNEDDVEYIWQIEVLDPVDHEYASERPWLKEKSWRRLTVMKADEW